MKLVGDKASFALECILSAENTNMGRIFLYIKGVRFGQNDFDEELDAFFFRILKEIKMMDNEFPDLFPLLPKEFVELVDCIYEDFTPPFCDTFKKFADQSREIDWNAILRSGLAFDNMLFGFISKGNLEKIVINENDVFAEATMKRGTFESYLSQLSTDVLPDFDWYKITCDTEVLIKK
ncbi:hypothetical protein ISG33_11105 [Glaciecola sp. MH2013]|uniref:Imm42 family immunity protein n=1 Tax=Glaciecola sp. MH2013 TaxID=2785524 RepID=UPI0018A0EEDE|nr:Imm42 family immunity protein [Glaciecola sp. MH2013]MBF7073947.1 hypothetical protein [Glaciecola sp. MH2013]